MKLTTAFFLLTIGSAATVAKSSSSSTSSSKSGKGSKGTVYEFGLIEPGDIL